MPQEPKTLHELVKDATHLCGKAGEASFAMGMRMAPISSDLKKVATSLLETGDQFEAIADAARKLANDVIEHDAANSSGIVIAQPGDVPHVR